MEKITIFMNYSTSSNSIFTNMINMRVSSNEMIQILMVLGYYLDNNHSISTLLTLNSMLGSSLITYAHYSMITMYSSLTTIFKFNLMQNSEYCMYFGNQQE